MSKTMQENLELFASLSGDYNPIHLDAHFAKNSYFGTQIIYGIYQVFCTLELALAKVPQKSLILSNIKATFHAPISKDLASQMKIKGSFSTHNIECSGGGAKCIFSSQNSQINHFTGVEKSLSRGNV